MAGGLMQLVAYGAQDIYIYLYYKQIIELINDLYQLRKEIIIKNEDNSINYEYTEMVNNVRDIIVNKYYKISDHDLLCVLTIYVAYCIDKNGISYNEAYSPQVKYFKAIYKNVKTYITPQSQSQEKIEKITPTINHLRYLTKLKDKKITDGILKIINGNWWDVELRKYSLALGIIRGYNKYLDNYIKPPPPPVQYNYYDEEEEGEYESDYE